MTARRGPFAGLRTLLGQRIAPPRFMLFLGLMLAVSLGWRLIHLSPPGDALVTGFNVAAIAFMVSLVPLMNDHCADDMRRHAAQNDASRTFVLLITATTAIAVLAAISAELPAAKHGHWGPIVKLIVTLALSWVFTNLVFMLHYAHMHYTRGRDGNDRKGFEFPGTPEPDYWDFLYFSFTAGMSFAASDVNVTRGGVRRVLVAQCLLSFVFNIGVLAFSINVLAGAAG